MTNLLALSKGVATRYYNFPRELPNSLPRMANGWSYPSVIFLTKSQILIMSEFKIPVLVEICFIINIYKLNSSEITSLITNLASNYLQTNRFN